MISVDKLSDEIKKQLASFSDEVAEKMKNSVDRAAEDCMREIQSKISFNQRTGKYVKNFRLKTSFENDYTKRKTWYVAGKEAKLTHLLEYGHAKANGGRTRAFPHIRYGENIAKENLVNYLKEEIE